MPATADRLRRTVDAYTAAVREVRTLDTEHGDEDDEATFDAKLELLGLDTGLVAPRFWGRLILFHTPEDTESAAVAAMLDGLEPLDAIARASRIVETARRDGPLAAHGAAETLARELRAWAEAALTIPEAQAALAAYRKDPAPFNRLGMTTEAI